MPQLISRRDFLALAGLGAGAVATGTVAHRPAATAATKTVGGRAALLPVSDHAARLLVVIEMAGGNDGLSMAPPADAARLTDLRGDGFDEAALLRPGNDVVLHPAFERLQRRPVTIVDGLGTPSPDGSHFEMLRRWWTGDPDGTVHPTTGFLGRLCDALDVGAPVTGLSIGSGASPMLMAARAGTLGLPDPGWLWWLAPDEEPDDPWLAAFRSGLVALGQDRGPTDGTETVALARRAIAGGLRAGEMLHGLGDSPEYPGTDLGWKLALTAQALDADVGVRVVHVPMDGDFDTHEDHFSRHGSLMAELDEALDTFLDDLAERGIADRVLVATVSEFGRRPELNGSGGLDHGTASTALIAGPVPLGRLGDPVDLSRVDEDDNFIATTTMDQYYATLAESWFGVPASDVLAGSVQPFALT
ncbi:DUF1501 domain-containing protein [Desertimonas flava]|jgi:uncharacterized protein (DUF1501 family)|uniref:DUF1501 domain-containing protein n=1 Tax=Desertimonas flava TaxID=2064846 RepID=UPI000E34F30D|nr:DUF1501 domain-containing protein [Desertimonas flava]